MFDGTVLDNGIRYNGKTHARWLCRCGEGLGVSQKANVGPQWLVLGEGVLEGLKTAYRSHVVSVHGKVATVA